MFSFQDLLMVGGFWQFIGDGCYTNRTTDKFMAQQAGFSQISQKTYDLPIREETKFDMKMLSSVIKPHVMGVATK